MKEDAIFQQRRARINELRYKNERMSHRERALMSVKHQEPDRVPIDNWMTPEIQKRTIEYFGCEDYDELLAFLGVDFRNNYGPSYVGQSFKKYPDGTVEDLWGVRRKTVVYGRGTDHEGTYSEVAESPLEPMATVEEIEQYERWASPDWWEYSKVKQDCAVFHPQYCVINVGDRLDRTAQLKPMMYLRGVQQTFVDLALNPSIVEAVRDHIIKYFVEYDHRVFGAAGGEIDIFMMGDDIGGQTGPLLSLDMWRRYFKKGFKTYIDIAHQYGIPVMYHTCGDVKQFIPEFIECGLDILQSLQPKATNMDIKQLKKEFGKDIAFQGGMDIQHTLPLGTPQDVREMVKYAMDSARQGGGYIICTAHNIQVDTPIENVAALFEAYHQFGAY
ncbi:MAG: uroporphyrinogen decarboxylase family protein [Thermodesulfobacteriota bacterium]